MRSRRSTCKQRPVRDQARAARSRASRAPLRWLLALIAAHLTRATDTLAYWPPLQQVEAVLTQTHNTQWRVSFRVFDPSGNAWHAGDSGLFTADQAYLQTHAGIVLWIAKSATPTVAIEGRFSVYDPALGQWCTTNSPTLAGDHGLSTWDGAVAWWDRQGTSESAFYLGASSYDPTRHQWVSHRAGPFPGIGLGQSSLGGLATFRRILRTGASGDTWMVHGWIFDPLRHQWQTAEFGPYTSGIWCIGVTGGSISVCVGGARYQFGYDYLTGEWAPGVTRPLACLAASAEVGFAPQHVWFTDLSVGATHWTWSFDDGTTSSTTTNRSDWHSFNAPGTNTVTLQISGPGGTALTNQTFLWRQRPRLLSLAVSNQLSRLELLSEPGSIQVFETSDNFSDWTDGPRTTNADGRMTVWETVPVGTSRRFYRVRQEAPLLP